MSKGWECPKCGKVFAPSVDECKYCNGVSENTEKPQFPYYPPGVRDITPHYPSFPTWHPTYKQPEPTLSDGPSDFPPPTPCTCECKND